MFLVSNLVGKHSYLIDENLLKTAKNTKALVFLRREIKLFHFHLLRPSTRVKDDGEHVFPHQTTAKWTGTELQAFMCPHEYQNCSKCHNFSTSDYFRKRMKASCSRLKFSRKTFLSHPAIPRPTRIRFPCVALRSVTTRPCIYVDAS